MDRMKTKEWEMKPCRLILGFSLFVLHSSFSLRSLHGCLSPIVEGVNERRHAKFDQTAEVHAQDFAPIRGLCAPAPTAGIEIRSVIVVTIHVAQIERRKNGRDDADAIAVAHAEIES